MSMAFHDGDDVLWSPSNQVGRLFKGQAEVIASVFDIPSGLGDIIEDECDIDPVLFGKFLSQLVRQHDTTAHPILKSLIVGFIGPALVLADRAGLSLPDLPPDRLDAWATLRQEQARSMSR